MTSFGEAIGSLIRAKREIGGFTQLELAIEAYDNETKVRRIVDIEKGYVARPQMKTIQPLIETLNISQAEINACYNLPTLSTSERRRLGLSEQLVEKLAEKFGVDHPKSDYQKLCKYLEDKAEQWKVIVQRISLMDRTNESVNILIQKAETAIKAANFESADRYLSKCESLHQRERTLVEVGQQSEIRALRASAALLSGDPKSAAYHFKTASYFFAPFDKQKTANCLLNFQDKLHWHGRRFGENALKYSWELGEAAESLFTELGMQNELAESQLAIALSKAYFGMRASDDEGPSQILLALNKFDEAIEYLQHRRDSNRWAEGINNRAIAKRFLGTRLANDEGIERIRSAISDYTELLTFHEGRNDKKSVARIQANLSSAQTELGRLNLPRSAKLELFEQSALNGKKASLFYRNSGMKENEAISLNNLGNALTEKGFILEGAESLAVLKRAIEAYEESVAQKVATNSPFSWALTTESIGLVYEHIASIATDKRRENLDLSLASLDSALAIYVEDVEGFYTKKCREARNRVKSKLEEINRSIP